jgi:hypothetical protein
MIGIVSTAISREKLLRATVAGESITRPAPRKTGRARHSSVQFAKLVVLRYLIDCLIT